MEAGPGAGAMREAKPEGMPLEWLTVEKRERLQDRSSARPASGDLPLQEAVASQRIETAGTIPETGREEPAELESAGTGLVGLIHDARSMVTAIGLYCDLLDEPDVLMPRYRHYARELRTVSAASRRLLERLSGLGHWGWIAEEQGRMGATRMRTSHLAAPAEQGSMESGEDGSQEWMEGNAQAGRMWTGPIRTSLARPGRMQALVAGEPIVSFAAELHSNQNLLTAVAGHGVTVGMQIEGGNQPVAITREDLTRVLVNLTRNAAEAMPGGGHLQIALEEIAGILCLSFTDSGCGIAAEKLEHIFKPGYSTHVGLSEGEAGLDERRREDAGRSEAGPAERWPAQHRGLGLAIVQSLVSAAGGHVWATNRSDGQGAVFTLELPVRRGISVAART